MTYYPDDTTLFQAFQAGRSDAEKTVFDRYFKSLCAYAEGITGDTVGTEDIVVDAFQKTWERRQNLPTLPDFKRYIFRVVYNAALDHQRAKRGHAGVHTQIRYLQLQQDAEGDDTTQREQLYAELVQEIYEEIEQLPDRCRNIFKLLFIEHLSTEQIAIRLNISTQTVYTQKARAVELLRTRLLRKGRILAIFLIYSLLGTN